MIDQKFTQSEYLSEMIKYTLHLNDFSISPFERDGRYFGRHGITDIVAPLGMRRDTFGSQELSYFGPWMYSWAYRNAELLRWSVVDESIPLRDDKRVFKFYDIFDGCRRTNVIALNYLKYWPALPELREAMLHEYDTHMRGLCVDTIGVMGERGLQYAKDIRFSITKFDDDHYYQSSAVEALGRLGDIEAVPLLRELYEATRDKIVKLSFDEAMNVEDEKGTMMLIDDISAALIKLDPESAREVLAMELANPNPHVRHFTKRAFGLSPLWHESKMMEDSYSVVLSYLPKDPNWAFQRRCRL